MAYIDVDSGSAIASLVALLFIAAGITTLVLAIVVVVDTGRHPEAVWAQAGQNRIVWIVLPLVLLVVCGVASLVVSIVYLTSIKKKLIAIEEAGTGQSATSGGDIPSA
ncbi:MAG: hypothetical protein FJW88_06575 [Actinobacteria bacterium]|nr:hypothetical protein [Actinomycetota bacterium]